MKLSLCVVATVLVVALTIALAGEKEPATESVGRRQDEQQIRDAAQALAGAFSKGSGNAIAGFWTEDGEYISDQGDVVRGRDALTKAYGEFAARRQNIQAAAKTESIRFLGKDVAVEDGVFTVRGRGAPTVATPYSTLYVRQDGRWLIALLKEDADGSLEAPKLADMAWLVGTWQSAGPEGEARITYEWADNKRFLKAHYSVRSKNRDVKATSGTEMLAVDPGRAAIRGWSFDDSGAFGDTLWKWDHGRWAIEAEGTQPDGSHTTALNLLTREGDDAFTWRSVKRTLDGEQLPDVPAVKVSRVSKSSAGK